MRLRRLEAWVVEMTLAVPYQVAYTSYHAAANVFVRLVTDSKLVGLGCAGPSAHVTGEDAEGVRRALVEVAGPLLEGADATRLGPLSARLEEALAGRPAARAAADMALHDLWAKRAGLPLWKILGGFREAFPISMMIGIESPEETLAQGRRYLAEGFRQLKVKGGHDVDGDVARLRALRQLAGPGAGIAFDANQGYDVAAARRFLDETRDLDLAFFEQPTPQDAPEMLAEVGRGRPGAGLMADECLMSPADALALAVSGGVEYFNLKLMRLGGLDACRPVLGVARAAGIGCMVGCMDESELAIAAGLALAVSSPVFRFADLDGHIGLGGDPGVGAVRLADGVLHPSEAPGLGLADLRDG